MTEREGESQQYKSWEDEWWVIWTGVREFVKPHATHATHTGFDEWIRNQEDGREGGGRMNGRMCG